MRRQISSKITLLLVAGVLLSACAPPTSPDDSSISLETPQQQETSTARETDIATATDSMPDPFAARPSPRPNASHNWTPNLLPRPVTTPEESDPTASPIAITGLTEDPDWPPNTDGKGCPAPQWPQGPLEDDPRRILIVGDSLTRESHQYLETELNEQGWLPTIRCWGGKGTDWGAGQILRSKELLQLPGTIVVGLGTNDVWWLGIDLGEGIDRIMQAAGPDKNVYWVNLLFGPNGYGLGTTTEYNRIISKKADQYENLTVIDFASQYEKALDTNSDVGWGDGVHLNSLGNQVRAKIIANALREPRLLAN